MYNEVDVTGRRTTGKKKPSSASRGSQRPPARREASALRAGLVAVRWADEAAARVSRALEPFGRIERIDAHRLLLLQRGRGIDRAALERRLAALHSKGLIEFATPVLRDPESHLRQIVTDEITVRFSGPSVPERVLVELGQRYGVHLARRNEFVPNQVVLKVDEPIGRHPLDVARDIDAADEVEFAAPNFISQIRRASLK
jgi:hypothetical protein